MYSQQSSGKGLTKCDTMKISDDESYHNILQNVGPALVQKSSAGTIWPEESSSTNNVLWNQEKKRRTDKNNDRTHVTVPSACK